MKTINSKLYRIKVLFLVYLIRFLTRLFSVEMPPIVSTAAIIEKNGKILFMKLSYLDGYGLPGGIIKSGETIEDALKREVYEETGLNVDNAVFYRSYPSRFYGQNTLSLVYLAKVSGKMENSEEGDLHWLEPKEVFGKFAYKDTEQTIKDYVKNK